MLGSEDRLQKKLELCKPFLRRQDAAACTGLEIDTSSVSEIGIASTNYPSLLSVLLHSSSLTAYPVQALEFPGSRKHTKSHTGQFRNTETVRTAGGNRRDPEENSTEVMLNTHCTHKGTDLSL